MKNNERPDIILIISDQQRADLCAREGFTLDTTPFQDNLATEGTCFTRAYTTAPVCCAARTSLFTGRFPSAHRVVENSAADLAVHGDHIFALAKKVGYTTAMVGKNHTWLDAEDVDYWSEYSHEGRIGEESDAQAAKFDQWLHNLRHRTATAAAPFPIEAQNPYRIVSDTLSWVNKQDNDTPLLAVVSFPEPHNPYQVCEPYFSLFPPEDLPPVYPPAEALTEQSFAWKYLHSIGKESDPDYDTHRDRARANYCGMLRLIDDQIQRLHEGLKSRHESRSRIIIITSDHGDYVGAFGLLRKGAELPEILTRIPMIITGDEIIPGSPLSFVSLVDVMPTICEAIGLNIPPSVQGRSLLPILRGESFPEQEFTSIYIEHGFGGLPYTEDDILPVPRPGIMWDNGEKIPRLDELNSVTQSGRHRKVRSGDWSIFAGSTGDFRLFNVKDDPFEINNCWDNPDYAEIRTVMLQLLVIWQMRAEDPLPQKNYTRKIPQHGYLAPYSTFPQLPG